MSRFTPEQDNIIREIYPRFGSRGVVNLLPQFCRTDINMRANYIGVKIDKAWKARIAVARCSGQSPSSIRNPYCLTAADIYPALVDRLAYTMAWR